jgi:hypothetical protein
MVQAVSSAGLGLASSAVSAIVAATARAPESASAENLRPGQAEIVVHDQRLDRACHGNGAEPAPGQRTTWFFRDGALLIRSDRRSVSTAVITSRASCPESPARNRAVHPMIFGSLFLVSVAHSCKLRAE